MLATIHLAIAIGTGLLVLYADEIALMWALGKADTISTHRIQFLHRAVTTGLVLLMLTGGIMYWPAAQAYLTDPRFVVKMCMVLALILNTYFISRFSDVAATRAYASLSPRERMPLFVSGAVSFIAWATAFTCGLLIA